MTKEKLQEISNTERHTIFIFWKDMVDHADQWPRTREIVMKSIKEMDKAVEVYNMENGKKE